MSMAAMIKATITDPEKWKSDDDVYTNSSKLGLEHDMYTLTKVSD